MFSFREKISIEMESFFKQQSRCVKLLILSMFVSLLEKQVGYLFFSSPHKLGSSGQVLVGYVSFAKCNLCSFPLIRPFYFLCEAAICLQYGTETVSLDDRIKPRYLGWYK
jgi:hypothetical protein